MVKEETNTKMWRVSDVAGYLQVGEGYVYKLTSRRHIPYYKINNKIFFDRDEIMDYMKQSRVKTEKELNNEALGYTIKKGGVL